MATQETIRTSMVQDKIDQAMRSIREMDIDISPECLVIRNVEEYLLIQEFREQKLSQARQAAKKFLKYDVFESNGPSKMSKGDN